MDGVDALPDPKLAGVGPDMSLNVLAYNMKRAMKLSVLTA